MKTPFRMKYRVRIQVLLWLAIFGIPPAMAYVEGRDASNNAVPGALMYQGSPAAPVTSTAPLAVSAGSSATVTNPSSTLTRPANTTAYAANQLVGNNVTAGSVTVPSVAIVNTAGGALIPRVRLTTNKTSGWDQVTIRVRLWTAAPTYTNGDGAAYVPATGAAALLGSYDVLLTQFGDGANGVGAPAVGNAVMVKLASGTALFWDMQYVGTAALTPASGQTFTLTAEALN